jgi:alkylation response protein AidB-like acyl-CoA dehydrogenase
MKFQLNDEQRALQSAVRAYLRDKLGPQQLRAFYDDGASDGVPAEAWKAFGEQGWLAVLVPEEHDGIGLGLLDAAVIATCFGAGTVPGPWLGTVLLGEAVRLYGSDTQRKALLPRIAAGEVKGAVALLKPGASPTPAGAPATAQDGTLTGLLELVEYGGVADTLLVAAQDGLYLVDRAATSVTEHQAMDRTTRLTNIALDGVRGERLEGSDDWQELLDRAVVLAAADLAGIARKALSDTVEYDKTRVQFGKPVGSFQALQHALADVHLSATMAEYAATYAAHAYDIDAPDKQLAASIAKAKAGDAANAATSAMVQFHGGIGFTWEHDTHFYLKRCKRLEFSYGDSAQHRERIAALAID